MMKGAEVVGAEVDDGDDISADVGKVDVVGISADVSGDTDSDSHTGNCHTGEDPTGVDIGADTDSEAHTDHCQTGEDRTNADTDGATDGGTLWLSQETTDGIGAGTVRETDGDTLWHI